MISKSITKSQEGQTSLRYLKRILGEAPNSFLFKMMRKKNIVLNDKKMDGTEVLKEGDTISFYLSDETFEKFCASSSNVSVSDYLEAYARFGKPDIVYEDDNVIVLNKPTDMLSQKAKKDDLSANEWLIGYLLTNQLISKESLHTFVPSVCNRLDRNTGGLLLFAKTPFGATSLNRLLKERSLHKYYVTIVKGHVKEAVTVKGYLYKDEKTNKVTIYSEKPDFDADYIETLYRPLSYDAQKDITKLEVLLITGKPHQIRAHLAFLNHPIIGDNKYGDVNSNRFYKTKYHLMFQLLYAVRLEFPSLDNYPALSSKIISIQEPAMIRKIMGE